MIIGVPTETKQGERRMALTPLGVGELVGHGHSVVIQRGAGVASSIPDCEYEEAGAAVLDTAEEVCGEARLILKVKQPSDAEITMLREDHVLFTYLHLAAHPEIAKSLAESGATCLAYETVQLDDGSLPLLAPMSEIAGRMSVQAGSRWLEGSDGGKGKLLGGAAGVPPARVTVLGAGVAGRHAVRVASGMGAAVTVMDIDTGKLRRLTDEHRAGVATCYSSIQTIEEFAMASDLIIGAVLVTGDRAPKVISEELVRSLPAGTVLVDISIDQGGCIATSHETTHAEPVYTVDGVIHYAVGNIPGVVPHTATHALTAATLPYVLALSEGFEAAFSRGPELERGVNIANGEYTHPTVARALGETARDPRRALDLAV